MEERKRVCGTKCMCVSVLNVSVFVEYNGAIFLGKGIRVFGVKV